MEPVPVVRKWLTFWRDQVVMVDWVDSFHSNGWDTFKDKLNDDCTAGRCLSVGWVFEDSEDWLGISPGLSGENSIDGLLRIPKVAVRSIVALRETGEKV